MCGASLSEYVGNGRDPDEKFLRTLFSFYEAVSLKILLIARSSGHVHLAVYEISIKDFPALKHVLHFVF